MMLHETFRPRFLGQVAIHRMGQTVMSQSDRDAILSKIKEAEDAMARTQEFRSQHPDSPLLFKMIDPANFNMWSKMWALATTGANNVASIKGRLSNPDPTAWTALSPSETFFLNQYWQDATTMEAMVTQAPQVPVSTTPGGIPVTSVPQSPAGTLPTGSTSPSPSASAAPAAFPTTLVVGGAAAAGLAALLIFH